MTVLLDGKMIAKELRKRTSARVNKMTEQTVYPKLAIVRVGTDPSSISYERAAEKEMIHTGILVEKITFPEDVLLEEVLDCLRKLNEDASIHGILVMQPFPVHLSTYAVSKLIAPQKDIDGFSLQNLGSLMQPGTDSFFPSTPQAVMHLLDVYGVSLKGKEVTIIGSSAIVGKPLSLLMLDAAATVTVCHIYTENLKKHTESADIVVSATGAVGLISSEHIKKGAIVIDVGYGQDEQGRVSGDVQFDQVNGKAGFLTPVPGGIGAITSAILAEHVLHSAERMGSDK